MWEADREREREKWEHRHRIEIALMNTNGASSAPLCMGSGGQCATPEGLAPRALKELIITLSVAIYHKASPTNLTVSAHDGCFATSNASLLMRADR